MRKSTGSVILAFVLMTGTAGYVVRAEEIVYDSGARRDPFIKVQVQSDAAAMVGGVSRHLQGIIYDPQKQSFAIFGGRTYKEGENVGNLRIQKILKDHVVLLVNGEEKTLRIRDEEKVRPM